MPVAYKVPLNPNLQDEFDALDLRKMRQAEVVCPLGCGTRYALIYDPAEVDSETLDNYRRSLEIGMDICNQHQSKIVLTF